MLDDGRSITGTMALHFWHIQLLSEDASPDFRPIKASATANAEKATTTTMQIGNHFRIVKSLLVEHVGNIAEQHGNDSDERARPRITV